MKYMLLPLFCIPKLLYVRIYHLAEANHSPRIVYLEADMPSFNSYNVSSDFVSSAINIIHFDIMRR